MKAIHPPALAERLLARSLPQASRDSVLGDLHEIYEQAAAQHGLAVANARYWLEILRALPGFWLFSLETSTLRRQTVTGKIFTENHKWPFYLGLLLLIPALLLVVPGLLQGFVGAESFDRFLDQVPVIDRLINWVDRPVFVLGGVLLAFGLSLMSLVRVTIKDHGKDFEGIVVLRKNISLWVLLSLATLLGFALLLYAIGENILPLL